DVQIVDYGPGGGPNFGGGTASNCQGPKGASFAPVYYTIEIPSSGAYALPGSDGPNTNLSGGKANLTPSHSICTATDNTSAAAGDNFVVQFIAFDYPAYEAAHSQLSASPPETPALTGAAGQADVTISFPVEEDWTGTGYVSTTLTHSRHALGRARLKPRLSTRPPRP
ncbi:MAG TPA: hypothetical protein VEJ20_06105, partial [Candidatus Eremiobacteraceae bacterium]|nr:hypothetical protein [Candidatus Eremiobacteraceae bacterium]